MTRFQSNSRRSNGLLLNQWIKRVDFVLLFFLGKTSADLPAANWRREWERDSDPRTAIENLGIELRTANPV